MENRNQKMLNVLSICSWYPNHTHPTLGNFVQKHAEAAALYNDVSVLSIFSSNKVKKLTIEETTTGKVNEFTVYYAKAVRYGKLGNKIINFVRHRNAFFSAYKLILNKIGKPDIVHLNIVFPLGIWALWLKKRRQIPYVITENSSGFHIGSDHSYPFSVLFLCKTILKNASYILPVSQNLKENLQQLSQNSRFQIISNVVDETTFSIGKKATTERKKLIHISTGIDSIKNLTGMIHVANQLSTQRNDFQLDIVSDGDTNYAKELVKKLGCGNCISFHSTKTTKEIAEMLQYSDALLMFSNYENFPCVIAEAFMSGLPVISSNVNGIPEHVQPQNGLLVNPRAEDELKKAIEDFLDDKVTFDADDIREYAIKHFSYTSVGKSFDTIYHRVLNQN